jgi:catalase
MGGSTDDRTTTQWLAAARLVAAMSTVVPVFAVAVEREHETPAQLVEALHSAFGEHHARAVHAKGVVLEGHFVPSPEARSLTNAKIFRERQVPIVVRFSDFTGIPDIPDSSPDANPRGFAIKLLASEGEMDVVTHSFNGFPTADSDDFAQFLRAVGASGPGATKPTPIELFLAAHPIARTFLETQKPPPESYATTSYFGVNAFAFVDARGHTSYVRYRFMPKAGQHYLDAGTLATKGPNYLVDEIPERVRTAPVVFDWYAQIANEGDAIDDPSVAWPETRRLVRLGTLVIDRAVADQAATSRSLVFIPARVPAGIAPADPMIKLRAAAYPISFGARQ